MEQLVRRALTLAVSSFAPAHVRDLPFAAALSADLAAALHDLGYLESQRPAGDGLTAADLGPRVREALTGGASDVVVVHVLSHGEIADGTGALYVLGSDGKRDDGTDVEQWLKAVENFEDRPLTLFLLDLCHAGTAARLPWQLRAADANSRAWVLAAAGPSQAAFAGRFTASTTAVLRRLAEGRLGIDASVRHVPLSTIARATRIELDRRCAAEDGLPQKIHGKVVDLSEDPDLPFFVNPRYQQRPRDQLLESVEESVRPFLDEVGPAFDPAHFISRASGRRPGIGDPLLGCFRGRAAELVDLVDWLDDDEAAGGLRVVTGSPGSGKSSLIGVLVCAAHPVLSQPTRYLWHHVAAAPSVADALAAVHARQRTVQQIVESVAAQLAVPRRGDEPWTADALVSQVRALAVPPIVVVDAVDESADPQALVADLVLTLAAARRTDGTPACRLLVAVRPWPEFDTLIGLAADVGKVIDLDLVPVARLRADLHDYVADLLRSSSVYQGVIHRRARRAIAELVAAEITTSEAPAWAPFLLAGVFVRRLLDRGGPVPGTAAVAALQPSIPHALPDLLDLDIADFASPWARPVLTVLAHARGDGMPVRVIALAAGGLADREPAEGDVAAALDEAAFYLRRSVDTDGTTLFRLFHHTLAERLRDALPDSATVFLDRVMAWAQSRWDAAEPYLLRHAIEHAADVGVVNRLLGEPEFLVHASPETLVPHLHQATTGAAIVYQQSLTRHSGARTQVRRQMLIVDAVRHAEPDLARRLGAASLFWQPVWARGVLGGRRHVRAVQVVQTAVVGEDGTGRLHQWGLSDGAATGARDVDGAPAGTRSSAYIEDRDRRILVTGADDGTVRLWDPAGLRSYCPPLAGHTGRVTALACLRLAGTPTAVTAAGDAGIRLWDLRHARPAGEMLNDTSGRVLALDCDTTGPQPIAVTAGSDGRLQVWDLTDRRPSGPPLYGSGPRVRALICLRLNGRPVVAAGGDDGTVRIWDLTDRCLAGPALPPAGAGVRALAVAEAPGGPLLVAGTDDGVLHTWDLTLRRTVSRLMLPYPIVALDVSGHHLVAATGAEVICWQLSGSQEGSR